MSAASGTQYCSCVYQAHCHPGKAGLCKLREGGTVNDGGGVCPPKGDGMAGLLERHRALLERVTVLERALEQVREIIDDDWLSREAQTGVTPRHEIRRATRALDG